MTRLSSVLFLVFALPLANASDLTSLLLAKRDLMQGRADNILKIYSQFAPTLHESFYPSRASLAYVEAKRRVNGDAQLDGLVKDYSNRLKRRLEWAEDAKGDSLRGYDASTPGHLHMLTGYMFPAEAERSIGGASALAAAALNTFERTLAVRQGIEYPELVYAIPYFFDAHRIFATLLADDGPEALLPERGPFADHVVKAYWNGLVDILPDEIPRAMVGWYDDLRAPAALYQGVTLDRIDRAIARAHRYHSTKFGEMIHQRLRETRATLCASTLEGAQQL